MRNYLRTLRSLGSYGHVKVFRKTGTSENQQKIEHKFILRKCSLEIKEQLLQRNLCSISSHFRDI